MNMLCILNPIAGGGRAAQNIAPLLRTLSRISGASCDIMTTQRRGDGAALAQQAARQGYSLVAAAGGDGTVNEVATGLVGSGATLGIIPVGSGNGLARALRIPLRYQDACKLLFEGTPKLIDVGHVAGRYFFATSGVGFDAHVGKAYNESPHHSRGIMPYVQIAVAEYFNYTPENVILRCNGATYCYTPFVLTVANTEQYGGGAVIAPGAVPDDGLFDVVIIPQASMLTMLSHAPRLFTRNIDTFPNIITHRAAALTVIRNFPGPAHVDGESFMAGETLEYLIRPRALSVLVPRKFS